MKRLILVSLLACSGSIFAEEKPAIELKRKSSFSMNAEDRNPFWPIGFHPAPKAATESAGPSIPASAFAVTSITLGGGTRFAIINDKTMGEGQQFGLQLGSQIYHVTVKRIEDGRVVLMRHDQEIVVPLRRR